MGKSSHSNETRLLASLPYFPYQTETRRGVKGSQSIGTAIGQPDQQARGGVGAEGLLGKGPFWVLGGFQRPQGPSPRPGREVGWERSSCCRLCWVCSASQWRGHKGRSGRDH